MKLTKRGVLWGFAVVLLLGAFSSLLLFSREKTESRVDFLMDTFVEQQITGKRATETGEAVYQSLRGFEQTLSLYRADSEISKINAAAGHSYVKVSAPVYTLLRRSEALCTASYDSFDFTIAPVTTLWHEAKTEGVPPAPEQIAQRLALVDYTQVRFNDAEKSVMLAREGMSIDLGGIAKGYACDIVREIYQNADISTALISIGGNVYTYGVPRGKQGYLVGVRDPLGDSAEPLLTLLSTEQVVATSGAYERFFEYEGVSYHHIIDKKTGMPAQSDLLSATVVSTDGALADFLSTTFYILGKDAVLEALRQEQELLAAGKQPLFELIAIDRDKNIYISPTLQQNVTLLESKSKQYQLVS